MEKMQGEGEQMGSIWVESALRRLQRSDRVGEMLIDAMRAAAGDLVVDKRISKEKAWRVVEEAKEQLMRKDVKRVHDLLTNRGGDEARIRHQLSVEGYSYKEVEEIIAAAKAES